MRAEISPTEILLLLTDGDSETAESVRGLLSRKIRVLNFPEQAKLDEKLQSGLLESQFEYVARMDADDIALPWRWARQMKLAESTGVDAVFSTAIVFGKELRPLPVLPQAPITLYSADVASSLVTGNPLVHPSLFAKKGALIDVGGYMPSPAEDLSLWLRMSLKGKSFLRDAFPSILYRYSPASMSHSTAFANAVDNNPELIEMRAKLARILRPNISSALSSEQAINQFRMENSKSLREKLASLGFGINS